MGDEDDELAVLFAAWREDIYSVPAPAMLALEAALALHISTPVRSRMRPKRCDRFVGKLLHRRSLHSGLRCPCPTRRSPLRR